MSALYKTVSWKIRNFKKAPQKVPHPHSRPGPRASFLFESHHRRHPLGLSQEAQFSTHTKWISAHKMSANATIVDDTTTAAAIVIVAVTTAAANTTTATTTTTTTTTATAAATRKMPVTAHQQTGTNRCCDGRSRRGRVADTASTLQASDCGQA